MKVKIILSACIVFTLAACTKSDPPEQPMLQDGPMSAQLGKMIYLGDHGYSRSTPFWGRNSDELFVTASTEILRIDIAAGKIEAIENSVGLVTGKTNENSGIIFIGKVNNQNGYYEFNFNTNSINKIIYVNDNSGTLINIAGNNIFLYESVINTNPCSGICWVPGPFVPEPFYHIDRQTQQKTELKNKKFQLFSPDGSRTILLSQQATSIYVFDNASRTIIDSSGLGVPAPYGLFFYNGLLHAFDSDITGNITIKNFNTGQVVRQYHTNNIVVGGYRVSADGTKLYYSGGILNANSLKIILYDIGTNTEKTIAELPYLQGGGLPFGSFVLSDDNKKMVTQSGNDLYVKMLE